MMKNNPKPHFGIDAPYIIAGFTIMAIFTLCIGIVLHTYNFNLILYTLWYFIALYCALNALFMLASSLYGKKRQARYLVSLLNIQGGERILDVGCGRGLLLITAAKKLTTGKAVGVDIWQQADQWANTKQNTQNNIKRAGVDEKVQLIDGDVRALPFDDKSFDIVMSNLVIHNLPTAENRTIAIQEMIRVLKPGGILLVQDFQFTQAYAFDMKRFGLTKIKSSGLHWWLFPPVRIVTGSKETR